MKKNLISLGALIAVAAAIIFVFRIVQSNDRKKDIEVENPETAKFDTLKSALQNSSYFENSEISPNKDYSMAIIDGKYDVTIKNSYYMMTIKDTEDEGTYCQIVDAIEASLGHKEGDSLTTCEETLAGAINTGHIDAEIYETYKVLTVNREEKSALYAPDNSHVEGELISVDEINYNIKLGEYLLTSLSIGLSKEADLYAICGHIYNSKVGTQKEFTFTLYNSLKEALETKNYTYENATKKFINFCVDFQVDESTVKYYSISETVD